MEEVKELKPYDNTYKSFKYKEEEEENTIKKPCNLTIFINYGKSKFVSFFKEFFKMNII